MWVPRQGGKMRLRGKGHAGLDADFHLEMPSGLLTLGGYHKATGNPRGRRGGFFRKSRFTPSPDPFAELHPQQRSSPCSRLLDLDKNLFGFLQGCSVSPAEGQGGAGAGSEHGGGCSPGWRRQSPQGAQPRPVLGTASLSHPEILPWGLCTVLPRGCGAIQASWAWCFQL